MAAEPTTIGFATGDWIVLVLYMVAMLVLGLAVSGGQKTKRDYFLGGRKLSWWLVGCSIVATETSALTFIGVPAYALGKLESDGTRYFTTGGDMLWMNVVVGYVIARVLVSIMLVPHYYRGDVYTPYQLLTRAFGPGPRYVAAGFSLLGMTLGAGVRVFVTAIPITMLMRTMMPEWGIWASVALFTVVALFYTAIGGLTAVVWTDMVQFFIFLGGGLFAMFYIPTLIDGGWSTVAELGASHLVWFNHGFVGPDAVELATGAKPGIWGLLWANIVSIFAGPFNIWMGLVGATIGVMVSHGVDQLNVQRVLACKSMNDGRKALIFSALVILPQFAIFLVVGVALFVYYSTAGNFDFMGLVPSDPTVPGAKPNADYVFPIFIITRMPEYVKGFMIAGIMAAAMSSVSSALSAISSVAIMDIYRPWRAARGHASNEAGELTLSRWATLGAGVALAAVALASQLSREFVFTLAFQLAGLTAGAMLGSILFAMRVRSGYPGPVIAGMVTSFLTMTAILFLTKFTAFNISWPWLAPIGTGVCYGVAWLASYGVPKPEGRDFGTETVGGD